MEKIDERMENFNRELKSIKKSQMGILLVEKSEIKNSIEWCLVEVIYSRRQGIVNWGKFDGNYSNCIAES